MGPACRQACRVRVYVPLSDRTGSALRPPLNLSPWSPWKSGAEESATSGSGDRVSQRVPIALKTGSIPVTRSDHSCGAGVTGTLPGGQRDPPVWTAARVIDLRVRRQGAATGCQSVPDGFNPRHPLSRVPAGPARATC